MFLCLLIIILFYFFTKISTLCCLKLIGPFSFLQEADASVEVKEPTHWSKLDLKVIKVCFNLWIQKRGGRVTNFFTNEFNGKFFLNFPPRFSFQLSLDSLNNYHDSLGE